jgi:hypothetical protein
MEGKKERKKEGKKERRKERKKERGVGERNGAGESSDVPHTLGVSYFCTYRHC